MSQEEAVCNLYEWVLPLRPFPSYRFLPFSSCLPVLSLPVFLSFLFLSSCPFSSCLLSFLFLSSCLSPSLAAFENKNVKRYNVNALSKNKNVTM